MASYTLVHEFANVQPQSRYHYVVAFADNRESSYFTLRARWRAGELPEIVGMVPVIEGSLLIDGRTVPLIGIDLVSDWPAAINLDNTQAQTELVTQDTVVVYGDDLTTAKFPGHIKVLDYQSAEQSFLLADIATAQTLLRRTGEIDVAWLRRENVPIWNWMDHLSPGITTGFGLTQPVITVPDFDVQTMEDWHPTQVFAGSIAFNMGLLGLLAVLVSGFIVFETTLRSIRRRAREFDRLQTIGVTNLQIRSVLVVEATVTVLFAVLVAAVLAYMFLEHSTLIDKVYMSTFLIATTKGLTLGLAAVLLGVALVFARVVRTVSWISLSITIVVAVAILYYGTWMTGTLAGAYLVIFALCLLHIVVMTPTLVQTIGALVIRLSPKSLISKLNLRTLNRQLQQANIAVIAFSLAIATAIGITVMISSLRMDFFELLDTRLPPALQVRDAGDVDPEIIRQWSGVTDVREYFRGEGNLLIGKTDVVATALDEFEARRYGYVGNFKRGGVYVNEKTATQARVKIGDEVSLTIPGLAPLSFPVIHIFKSYGEVSRVVLVPQDEIPRGSLFRDRLLIRVQPDSLAAIQQKLQEFYPSSTVLNHRQIRERAIEVFDRTFALTNLIALIAVFVAVIGLFNSALAMQGARRDEYRLLNTLGFTRLALFKQSLTQATLLGLVCCLLSIPLGLAVAWTLCELVNPRAFQWTIDMQVSLTSIGTPLVLGLIATVLASLLPWFLLQRGSR